MAPTTRPPYLDEAQLSRIFSVEEFEPLAKERLHSSAYAYIQGGAGSGWTARQNVVAFQGLQLRPRPLVDVGEIDLSTAVLGTPIRIPIIFAAAGLQRLAHPDGELATARAALALDTIKGLSTGASADIVETAAIGHKRWFQLYWASDHGLTRSLVERAAAAGYGAIVLTVDAAVPAWREELFRVSMVGLDGFVQPILPEGVEFRNEPALTWQSLDWLRSISSLPLVLKGILRADDARLAADAGVDGIIVSNHGGRQVDGACPTIEALPAIVDAVGDRIEVYLDGGVRRGTDVLKALALGARAVGIGRPIFWALATGGELGVLRLMDLMTGELTSAMGLCGCRTVAEITPAIVRRNPDPVAA